MSVKVKICGLMRAQDAAGAVAAGASYLGVVFAGGPRVVTGDEARSVVDAASGVPVLGVFAGQPLEAILQACERAGLSGVQLHGSHSPVLAARLRQAGLVVWRVVRIAALSDLDLVDRAVPESDAVLVEPRVPGAQGGAGVPLDLGLAREARRRLPSHAMVLAGGLTPETVGGAVAAVQPEIVDVSSGVESQPGIKDPVRLFRFVEAAGAHSQII